MRFKLPVFVFLSILSLYLQAQDQVKTDQGTLELHPITHGTLALIWDDKTIYVDPYGGARGFEGLKAPDIILITDIHGDHLDIPTLEKLETSKAKWIVPEAVAAKLPKELAADVTVIANGAKTTALGVEIEAIPMYNLPQSDDAFHTKGRGNGYVLTMGNKRIYLSGDTEDIPEMRTLKKIDIAFVCMNLPYTMDIHQAASAVLEFKPKIVYPYHYRGQGGLSDVKKFEQLVNDGDESIEVRLRNWYP
ncbi:MAG: MBL fold metallo-hydrolase [Cytophagales bacterium]|nr:MBL fold metallo-hydrolase [Cytophagales bacterium]